MTLPFMEASTRLYINTALTITTTGSLSIQKKLLLECSSQERSEKTLLLMGSTKKTSASVTLLELAQTMRYERGRLFVHT